MKIVIFNKYFNNNYTELIKFIAWRASTSYRCIEEPRFDKFLNGYVVTFNPDQNHAMNIMKNETDKQLKKIEKTYKSWKELSSILEDEGGVQDEKEGNT